MQLKIFAREQLTISDLRLLSFEISHLMNILMRFLSKIVVKKIKA